MTVPDLSSRAPGGSSGAAVSGEDIFAVWAEKMAGKGPVLTNKVRGLTRDVKEQHINELAAAAVLLWWSMTALSTSRSSSSRPDSSLKELVCVMRGGRRKRSKLKGTGRWLEQVKPYSES